MFTFGAFCCLYRELLCLGCPLEMNVRACFELGSFINCMTFFLYMLLFLVMLRVCCVIYETEQVCARFALSSISFVSVLFSVGGTAISNNVFFFSRNISMDYYVT